MGKLQSIYTIGQLARLAGISKWRVVRTLQSNGVPIRKSGNCRVVGLKDLRDGLPWFWDSIVDRQHMARIGG